MSLKTIGLVSTLVLRLLAGPLPAEAQQAGKVYRIGWLRFSSSPPTGRTHIAFRHRLRELGYVEGQNLVLEYRSAKYKHDRYPEIAAELVRLKVDVIVTSPAPPAIRAAQQATRTIPIIMAGVYVDPVAAGFVASLARPGSNITGITNLESDLHPKRLELLKEAFPRISRAVILWPRYEQTRKRQMKEVEDAGQALGIQIQSLVRTGQRLDEHLESVFSAISRESPDALLVADNALIMRHGARIREFTAKRQLPTMYTGSRYMDAGGLMSYGANLPHLFHQAATYVHKILKGAKPADLPVERPTKFELIINLKTAKKLGLTIPPEVLFQADKIIK
jgi:putative ABC transport system substrate-binding protein